MIYVDKSSDDVKDKNVLNARIEEYRRLLKDFTTPDDLIKKRLEYLEALFRNVIRIELENYAKKIRK